MEETPQDKDINSLEQPDTIAGGSTADGDKSSNPEDKPSNSQPPPETRKKKEKINQRVQNLITKVNIYLLLFVLILLLAGVIVFISIQRSKTDIGDGSIDSQQLSPEELSKISGSDTKVGDPKQTLTIESNAVFSGNVLVQSSLDVAGQIKVGSNLDVPGLNVSGQSTLGQVAANELTVAGSASIQGQLNVQGNLAITGSSSFGGPISAPQATIESLQTNGDLVLNRHLDAGGPTPGKSNGSAIGSGGTSSLSGTDTAGTLTVNVGGSAPAGCFATINFARPFNDTPHVIVTPVGSGGGVINFYVNRSSSSFSICTSTPPPSGTSFAFDYFVID